MSERRNFQSTAETAMQTAILKWSASFLLGLGLLATCGCEDQPAAKKAGEKSTKSSVSAAAGPSLPAKADTKDTSAAMAPAVEPAAKVASPAGGSEGAAAPVIYGEPGSPSAHRFRQQQATSAPAHEVRRKNRAECGPVEALLAAAGRAAQGAPNVLLIMTDDVGFGAPSTFGGVIPTPALDRIASSGLRYTQFHSCALCSPTRAAVITGRNHHSAGFGVVSEQATGYPGYDSVITRDKATIGRILKDNGYRTSWFGKDHNTPAFQASQDRPLRPVAHRHGLRVLLRLRRRRHQPVAAQPLPQHDADLPLRRKAGMEPDHRHGR